MCRISDTDGCFGYDETPWENGDSSASSKLEQSIIKKALLVSILHIFKYYNIDLDVINRKTICPFKFHSGGKERSPSFYYYHNTNSFWCFGCKTGTTTIDFVMNMDNIGKVQAASKILDLFESEVDENNFVERKNYSENFEILMKLSSAIFDFRNSHFQEKDFEFIENICKSFDLINAKHELNNKALLFVTDKLIEKINKYE
jgi:hypothetical protein